MCLGFACGKEGESIVVEWAWWQSTQGSHEVKSVAGQEGLEERKSESREGLGALGSRG